MPHYPLEAGGKREPALNDASSAAPFDPGISPPSARAWRRSRVRQTVHAITVSAASGLRKRFAVFSRLRATPAVSTGPHRPVLLSGNAFNNTTRELTDAPSHRGQQGAKDDTRVASNPCGRSAGRAGGGPA